MDALLIKGSLRCLAILVSLVAALSGIRPPLGIGGVSLRSPVPSTSIATKPQPALLRIVRVGLHPLLLAIDASSGRVFVVDKGKLASGNAYDFLGPSSVSVLDAATGHLFGMVALPPGSIKAIAVAARQGRVFVFHGGSDPEFGGAIGSGRLTVLDARSGAPLHTVALPQQPSAAVAIDPLGVVYALGGPASGGPGSLYRLDASSGKVLAAQQFYGRYLAADSLRGRLFVADTVDCPQGGNDTGNPNGCIDVLGARTGATLQTILLDNPTCALAVDEATGLLLIDQSDTIHLSGASVADPRTGNLVSTVSLPGDVPNCALAIDGLTGHAFVANGAVTYGPGWDGGHFPALTMLDVRTGQILRTITLSFSDGADDVAAAVDQPLHRLYVATQGEISMPLGTPSRLTGPGVLSVFDTRTGSRLARVSLGRGPQQIAVDERTARVFVTNEADGTVEVFDATKL